MTAPQDRPAKEGRSLGPITAGLLAGVAAVMLGSVIYAAMTGMDLKILPGATASASSKDLLYVLWYGVPVILGNVLAQRVVHDSHVRRWTDFGYFAAVIAVAADLLETLALVRGWSGVADVSAVVKVSAALPAVAIAVIGVLLTLFRLASFRHRRQPETRDRQTLKPEDVVEPRPLLSTEQRTDPKPPLGSQRARWLRGYRVPKTPNAKRDGDNLLGICLSGGGVRAASVMLGALQEGKMRESVLPNAAFLVSVSGGGYTAGAFQQALTDAGREPLGDEAICDPKKAFLEGSAEEDHIRRHASYLADSPAKMVVALGLLARHLLLTLLLLFGPAIVLGVLAGTFYRTAPVTPYAQGAPGGPADPSSFPTPISSAIWAIAVLAGIAGIWWLCSQFCAAHKWRKLGSWFSRTAPLLSFMAVSTAIVTILLPTIIWVSALVLQASGGFSHPASSPIAAVLLTYVASLASLLWRNRTKLKTGTDGLSIPAAAPRGVVQIILVIASLLVLSVGWLMLLGGSAVTVLPENNWSTIITAGAVFAVVVALGGLVDETTLSLHPFYRRRLASAFAVRAVKRHGEVVALPYEPTERTTLSEYGKLAAEAAAGFPEVIFAASATLGDQRTPPGNNRVSYTFSGDWVGGAELGYIRTKKLEDYASARLQRDLTVQGAVALSGAALAASAGGQNASWYETLFAVSGVRLGAWMPNPLFLIEQQKKRKLDNQPVWYEPSLPHVRRLSYLLRELFGIHPANGPLVQVTDGGFYDNLGLIELFRRGCTRIYCIDASGDTPPPATTLAGVLTLAYQELGVKVRLNQTAFDNTPGTGAPTKPEDALTALNPRLAKSGIITGQFTYPPESGMAGERTGLLVVAKASLWDRLPYPLLAYAMNNPIFPNDSTADQWFDDNQYAAYTALGRELGQDAVQAMADLEKAKQAEDANQARPVEPPQSSNRNGAKKPGATSMAMRLLLSRLAMHLTRLASTSDH